MSNELKSDLKHQMECWNNIRNEFNLLLKEKNDNKIIITTLKEECIAARTAEKSLAANVEDLKRQLINTNLLIAEYDKFKKEIEQLKGLNDELKTDHRNRVKKLIKKYESERSELLYKIESLNDNLRQQTVAFKDEKELIQSSYLIQICDLNEKINEMKNAKSDDLNLLIVDYENKLLERQEFIKKVQNENSALMQKLNERDNEILQLKNKLKSIENTISSVTPNQNSNTLNFENSKKQNEKTTIKKVNEPANDEKPENKHESQLNLSFVDKKYNFKVRPSIYNKTPKLSVSKKDIKKKNQTNETTNSFNDGCLYTIHNNVVSKVNTMDTSIVERISIEMKRKSIEIPEYIRESAALSTKRPLDDLQQATVIASDDNVEKNASSKGSKKKRILFSHTNDEIDLPLDDVDTV